jgi:hypothetical protein
MTFSRPALKFSAEFADQVSDASGSDFRIWRIKERNAGRLTRSFAARVPGSQSARSNAARDIELWCELNFDKLPVDGGTFIIDLDSIRIE